jgi:hypothetical protein
LTDDESKVCLKVHYGTGDPDVMILKWSDIQRDCNSRDHITSAIGSSSIAVPTYKSKEVYNHHGKFVSVSLRTYIPGETLEHVMPYLSEDDIDAIHLQIEAITWALAKKTSPHFGHVQDDTLRTTSASGYIRTRSFLDKLTAKIFSASFPKMLTLVEIGIFVLPTRENSDQSQSRLSFPSLSKVSHIMLRT